ncbi:hypothetical protein G7074_14800 [Pedobacter sp. HDW13]|uniref:Qat anti-phage system QueC-like protein QatC n=1 Tax=Pedobacter sp. HDW13 TaxID=2714940 RepID=UPI00140798C8|nr:Qat anti-phage system QueC-like protein QatC [Pedobacter sp. HDW13]QIL40423.1 hypothetical protein G7074_14800 [Pedobacter sp. HDW13]
MSAINIHVKFDPRDATEQKAVEGDKNIVISISQADRERWVTTNIISHLHDHRLALKDEVFDLLRIGIAIYTVDQTVSRKENGFQGWSRYLKVNLPVYDPAKWKQAVPVLEEMLSFLSGDKWEIKFRKNKVKRETQSSFEKNANGIEKVCLFSGGLDSFISSIDLLRGGSKVAFVSHYKASESAVQTMLYDALAENFSKAGFERHKIRVQPVHNKAKTEQENSSRARSFLFFCLGIAVANAHGEEIPLIIPENGLISLNIPLTLTRLSSHSTRTTHPYYLDKWREMLEILGLKNKLVNPYQFRTKGEMMAECKDRKFLNTYYPHTISCSHPEVSRYEKKKPGLNCGYCVPCIIRQAAEKRAGKVLTAYSNQILKDVLPNQSKKGSDLRAFQMAFQRNEGMKSSRLSLQVLRSGPLPYQNPEELSAYIDVYKRGMEEVKNFLKDRNEST